MTQAPETQAVDTLTLSDIAAEIGLELTAEEPTPPDQSTEQADPNAETDPSQENTEETQDSPDSSDSSDDTDTESKEKSEDEATDETEEEAPAPAQEKLLRRIDKITAKRREAEERAEQLEAELQDLRVKFDSTPPVTLAPTPADPLADIETPEALEERISVAKKVKKWALSNLEGASVTNAAGEEVYYEPAQVREFLANADEVLTEHAPKRREWLANRQTFVPEARAAYPALFQAGSQEQAIFRETLKAYPALKNMPNLELIIGDAIEGQKLRFARQQRASKASSPASSAKAPVKSAPSAPSPAKGQKVPAKDINARASAKALFERGSNLKSDDIAAFLEGAL